MKQFVIMRVSGDTREIISIDGNTIFTEDTVVEASLLAGGLTKKDPSSSYEIYSREVTPWAKAENVYLSPSNIHFEGREGMGVAKKTFI